MFRFSPDKLIDAVDLMLRRVGPCTRMKLVKLLYMADRYHIVRHGTPVLGDSYYRLPWGPVPSRSLDLLEATADVAAADPEVEADEVSRRLLARVEVSNAQSKYATYSSRGVESAGHLSASEVEALDAAAEKFGGMSAMDLSKLTHTHKAFLETPSLREIDYKLFFLDEPGARPEALQYLTMAQEDHSLLLGL